MRALTCCLLVLVLVTVACGASGPPTATTRISSIAPTAIPTVGVAVASAIAAAPTQSPAPAGMLFANVTHPTPGIRAVDTRGSGMAHTLPAGVLTPDWSALYTASYDGTRTEIAALDPVSGVVRRTTTLDHSYQFQWDDGYGLAEAGRTSPDGHWLALTGSREYHADGRVLSRFAVLDTAFAQPARLLTLNGTYTFDALANDGQTLYLIENLPMAQATATPAADAPPRYRVVFVDLRHPIDAPQVLVDKTTQGATMAGTRQSVVMMPDGQWLFSLYRNPKQPFIHALNLRDQYAVCIFLPASSGDPAQGDRWALTRTADATRLYAANSTTGTVVEIDAASLSTLRTVTLTMDTPAAAHPLAAVASLLAPQHVTAKGNRIGTGIAVTPDGSTLAVSGGQGITLIDTRDLHGRVRVLTDQQFGSMAISPDGRQLYAFNMGMGALIVLDPTTGAQGATIPIGRDLWDFTILHVT